MNQNTHQRWLLELTALPTAAGHERRVIEWITAWAKERPEVLLRADRFGNLVLSRRGARSPRPIFFTAHMDHPAFVVVEKNASNRVVAEFRGGVDDRYFVGSRVLLHGADGSVTKGVVRSLAAAVGEGFKRVEVELVGKRKSAKPQAWVGAAGEVGDLLTWDVGRQRVKGDRLFTAACDDLAGVAAAVAAFGETLSPGAPGLDVRVLLTRAEEVGFVGAIAACKARTMPRGSRVIALENSKSFAESPIGGGPIVRVGDRTSTFDPDLTYRLSRIAAELAGADPSFKWQRKLMTGGTCEASVYQSYGHTATCLCLPLGNYHNMNEATGKIDAETISLGDYHGLIRLLVAIAEKLDDSAKSPSLRKRLDGLFARQRGVLKK